MVMILEERRDASYERQSDRSDNQSQQQCNPHFQKKWGCIFSSLHRLKTGATTRGQRLWFRRPWQAGRPLHCIGQQRAAHWGGGGGAHSQPSSKLCTSQLLACESAVQICYDPYPFSSQNRSTIFSYFKMALCVDLQQRWKWIGDGPPPDPAHGPFQASAHWKCLNGLLVFSSSLFE